MKPSLRLFLKKLHLSWIILKIPTLVNLIEDVGEVPYLILTFGICILALILTFGIQQFGWGLASQLSVQLNLRPSKYLGFSENSTKVARTSRSYAYVSKCLPGIPRKFKIKNTKIFLCALRTPWLRLTTVRF